MFKNDKIIKGRVNFKQSKIINPTEEKLIKQMVDTKVVNEV